MEILNQLSSVDIEDLSREVFNLDIEYADNDNYTLGNLDQDIGRKLYEGDEVSIEELSDIFDLLISQSEPLRTKVRSIFP